MNRQDVSAELEILKIDFHGDFDTDQLHRVISIWFKRSLKDSDPVDFVDKEIRPMIKNIWTITRIVLTSGATSATPETHLVYTEKDQNMA